MQAWKKWREGRATDIVDTKMRAEGSIAEVMRCVHIGLLCVQENLDDRPTMASVGLMLRSYSVSLRAPSRPAYFTDSSAGSSARLTKSNQPQNVTVPASQNEASLITQLHPR